MNIIILLSSFGLLCFAGILTLGYLLRRDAERWRRSDRERRRKLNSEPS